MPTPLEPFVETKVGSKSEKESLGTLKREPSANIVEPASGDSHKNKQQPSPRRKFVNRSTGNRNNRNNSLNKRSASDNNNNNNSNNGSKQINGFKAHNAMNQHQKMTMQNDYQKPPPNDKVDAKKHSNQKFRSNPKAGQMGSYYDDRSPASSPTTEPQKPTFNMPQPKHELDNMQRKYTMDFLHQVGYKITNISGMNMPQQAQHSPKTPKHIDDANLIALKMALGDNSGFFTPYYAGSMYGNQMVLHQQQQQQQQLQQFTRYQQQQPPIQRLQRLYPRGPHDNYQRMYQPPRFQEQEGAANLPCHCSQQTAPQYQRSYSNSYSSSYQNGSKNERRDYRDNRDNSKKSRNNMYQTDKGGYQKDFHNRNNQPGKSDNFSEEAANKAKNFNRAHSDDLAYRSLSPTPPNSLVSSSPGSNEKNIEKHNTISAESTFERAEDSLSTASASSSVPSNSGNLKVSQSTPILLEPEKPSISLWIHNNNFIGSKNLRSVSAENLNVVTREPPVTIYKRPPSAVESNSFQAKKNVNNSSNDPQQPFDQYLSRAEDSEMHIPPAQLRCGSQWDGLSEEMWKKFTISQQSRSTYRKKMLLWRDLHGLVKVRCCIA